MIAGTNSGCGKTTVTCGILQALISRKMSVCAFKCGPDYTDPIIHRSIGCRSYNLDGYFCDDDLLCHILHKNGTASDVSVIEGVMGFYDGVNNTASSFAVSNTTQTPVIIVVNCRGMGESVGAVMKGYLTYKQPNHIIGFIFNHLPEQLTEQVKAMCNELGTEYFGFLPKDDCTVKNIDLNKIISYARSDKFPQFKAPALPEIKALAGCSRPVRIAVAKDEAFCYIYEDNINFLREAGCEIKFFSPVHDTGVPESDGLILSGGAPELYTENEQMFQVITKRINDGIPLIAEGNGFVYLHRIGIINARAFKTKRLGRFGYIEMTAERDNLLCGKGEKITAHEYHYWDSTDCGNGFTARKISNNKEWQCVITSGTMYAGFPQIYFYANPQAAVNFINKCIEYRRKHGEDYKHKAAR
jgi:cobyrinic acid a,c-diamide synthase